MNRDPSLDVAIVGMAGRFPGCSSLADWWRAICRGAVLTTRYDRERLVAARVPERLVDDPDYVPVHGHLDDAERFDNEVFRMSRRDAELTDPQHRLMLETAWAALEDAGSGVGGDGPITSVYASRSDSGYLRALIRALDLDPATLDQALHGAEPDFIAGLIAYKLGLRGPAMAVQTACSSGLVGVHLAVQGLVAREVDRALVVAAGIPFPQAGQLHLPGGIQSPSGRCRPFDAEADGVVAGSGVVAVVLRRRDDVEQEGAPPYATIIGSAIGNDGAAKAGFFAPSIDGQIAVIRAAFDVADIDASTVGYLETHGTGTAVGDPIEWAAASDALAGLGAEPGTVRIGALKANTGHLDAAAGLAGLVKAAHVVGRGIVPPLTGHRRPNPLLDLDGTPLVVPHQLAGWDGPEPRRAGVSSFGIGGTNAHVLVEAPDVEPARSPGARQAVVVPLSAADTGALERSARRLAAHLREVDVPLLDVGLTLAEARASLLIRQAVVGPTREVIAERLERLAAPSSPRPVTAPPVVLLCPGQGSQRPGMAITVVEAIPGVGDHIDAIAALLEPGVRARVRAALLDPDHPPELLDQTEVAQPALFVLQVAVGRALRDLGIEPAGAVGHSLGEVTALTLAGALQLDEAVAFVTARGRAIQECPSGAMLAVGCDEAAAQRLVDVLGVDVDIAAVNTPDQCVLAGSHQDVDAIEEHVGDRMLTTRLRTSYAFHSHLLDGARDALAAAVAELHLRPPAIPVGSNVTGEVFDDRTPLEPHHLVVQPRRTVRFARALDAIVEQIPGAILVEIGPGRALSSFARGLGLEAIGLDPRAPGTDASAVLEGLADLWCRGHPVDLGRLHRGGRRAHLPTYPFHGPRWMAAELRATHGGADAPVAAVHPSTDREPEGRGPSDPSALVTRLWRELLGVDHVDEMADFFQLGGDSMLVTHLARRVREATGTSIPLRELLAARTLLGQQELVARLVDGSAEG